MKRVIRASDNIKDPIVVVVDENGAVTPLFRFPDYEDAEYFCELYNWTCDESLDRYERGRLEIRDDSEFHAYD